MLLAQLRFVATREDASADGWEVSIGDEQDAPTVTYHATITAAQAAVLAAFQADTDVTSYFTGEAEASVLGTEAAAVAAALAAALAAEGL